MCCVANGRGQILRALVVIRPGVESPRRGISITGNAYGSPFFIRTGVCVLDHASTRQDAPSFNAPEIARQFSRRTNRQSDAQPDAFGYDDAKPIRSAMFFKTFSGLFKTDSLPVHLLVKEYRA